MKCESLFQKLKIHFFSQDSLAKFAGRKLKDCGEDLLVEISEVLFNELAFFKLMQDLDSNSISVKQRCKRKIETAEEMQSYAKEVCLLSLAFLNFLNVCFPNFVYEEWWLFAFTNHFCVVIVLIV